MGNFILNLPNFNNLIIFLSANNSIKMFNCSSQEELKRNALWVVLTFLFLNQKDSLMFLELFTKRLNSK